MRPGLGAEIRGRVLGVEPGLDGVAVLGRTSPQAPSGATWICSLTGSVSVVASVIGCSTWEVLTSRKAKVPSWGWKELDGARLRHTRQRWRAARCLPRHLRLVAAS